LLFAGAPERVPPQRPAGLAPAPTPVVAPAADPAAAAPTDPSADPIPFADPALAGARPRPRPADLATRTVNTEDDASLAPAAGSRFASLRPRARPAELVQVAAPTVDLGAQAASLTAQAAANAAAAPRSPLAVAVSRKPQARPKDFSRAVEAAVAAAVQQPEPRAPVEEPTEQAPEADEEPEVAKAMPRLPTKASVAKQATFVNAINLSKTNLIGVYGSQSDRHALVRLSSGRYKKVSVGDSIDGGRVAAITASELRYKKSGKMVTLALPKG
ncbi:MAG: translation initiation factor 2, partial [Paracoccaceae bacterium]